MYVTRDNRSTVGRSRIKERTAQGERELLELQKCSSGGWAWAFYVSIVNRIAAVLNIMKQGNGRDAAENASRR